MKNTGHFIGGAAVPADGGSPIFNPATAVQTGIAAAGTTAEIDMAVAAARGALASWAGTGLQQRASVMLDLRQAVRTAREELTQIVIAELGKTEADATAEIDRAIEVLGQSASVGTWYGAPF
jgi:acyl-CoA reductase-like NAD-dependent aldehyde dehydrogenase